MRKIVAKSTIAAFVLFQFSVVAFASGSYKCIIKKNYELDKNGIIKHSDSLLGLDFVVDKKTGRMMGALGNHNSNGQPVVLDYGSKEQAYKVLTIFKPYVRVNYLYVEEFMEGKEKPFMFLGTIDMASGICVDY